MARACVGAAAPGASEAFLDAVAGGESSGVHAAALCAFREAVERTVAEGFAARRAERRDAINAAAVFFEASFPSRARVRARRGASGERRRRADALLRDARRALRGRVPGLARRPGGRGARRRVEAELRGCRNPGKRSDKKKRKRAKPFALARRARERLALRFPAEARARRRRRWPPRRRRRGTPALWSPRSRRWPRRRRGVRSRAAPTARRSVSRRARTRATLEETLARAVAANDATRAFAAAAPLLLTVATGRAVSLTGRSFGNAIGAFREGGIAHGALRDEDVAFLDAFHEDLVAALARVSSSKKAKKKRAPTTARARKKRASKPDSRRSRRVCPSSRASSPPAGRRGGRGGGMTTRDAT